MGAKCIFALAIHIHLIKNVLISLPLLVLKAKILNYFLSTLYNKNLLQGLVCSFQLKIIHRLQ